MLDVKVEYVTGNEEAACVGIAGDRWSFSPTAPPAPRRRVLPGSAVEERRSPPLRAARRATRLGRSCLRQRFQCIADPRPVAVDGEPFSRTEASPALARRTGDPCRSRRQQRSAWGQDQYDRSRIPPTPVERPSSTSSATRSTNSCDAATRAKRQAQGTTALRPATATMSSRFSRSRRRSATDLLPNDGQVRLNLPDPRAGRNGPDNVPE